MNPNPAVWALCAAGICYAQAPADCKPNPLNVPEAKYPCIFPDNRVMHRVNAPNAQAVRVGNTNLTKGTLEAHTRVPR